MPAYNFMQQWEPKILDGSKAQTIRRRRKHPTKPGQTLSLYTGQRTKNCRLIGHAPCVKVEPVILFPFLMYVKVNGHLLSDRKAELLAELDGFDTLQAFFKFFQRYREPVLDDFEIVYWDPEQLQTP